MIHYPVPFTRTEGGLRLDWETILEVGGASPSIFFFFLSEIEGGGGQGGTEMHLGTLWGNEAHFQILTGLVR